jgi:hypothetical protein
MVRLIFFVPHPILRRKVTMTVHMPAKLARSYIKIESYIYMCSLYFRPGNEWLCSHCSLTFTSASVLNLHTLAHAADNLEETETITGLPSDFHSVYHAGEFLVQNGDVQCPQCTQVCGFQY